MCVVHFLLLAAPKRIWAPWGKKLVFTIIFSSTSTVPGTCWQAVWLSGMAQPGHRVSEEQQWEMGLIGRKIVTPMQREVLDIVSALATLPPLPIWHLSPGLCVLCFNWFPPETFSWGPFYVRCFDHLAKSQKCWAFMSLPEWLIVNDWPGI